MGTADIWTGTGSSQRRPGAGGGALGDESCWAWAAGEAPDDAPDVEVRAQGRARGVLDSATRSSTCSVQSEAWRAAAGQSRVSAPCGTPGSLSITLGTGVLHPNP